MIVTALPALGEGKIPFLFWVNKDDEHRDGIKAQGITLGLYAA